MHIFIDSEKLPNLAALRILCDPDFPAQTNTKTNTYTKLGSGKEFIHILIDNYSHSML